MVEFNYMCDVFTLLVPFSKTQNVSFNTECMKDEILMNTKQVVLYWDECLDQSPLINF